MLKGMCGNLKMKKNLVKGKNVFVLAKQVGNVGD